MKQILGIILIVAGAALAVWGYDIYDSASAQLTRLIDGDTPPEAWAGLVGGTILVLVGLLQFKNG